MTTCLFASTIVPASGFNLARQDMKQRRLARAVRPDDSNDLTLLHAQAGAVEDEVAAALEGDLGRLEHVSFSLPA